MASVNRLDHFLFILFNLRDTDLCLRLYSFVKSREVSCQLDIISSLEFGDNKSVEIQLNNFIK